MAIEPELLATLERRLGRLHARQRLGIEADHEAQIFGQGLNFFHIENWYSVHSVLRTILKLCGLYWRGRRNAENIVLNKNDIRCARLPPLFDGFTVLHISDPHVDMNQRAMLRVAELVRSGRLAIAEETEPYVSMPGETGTIPSRALALRVLG